MASKIPAAPGCVYIIIGRMMKAIVCSNFWMQGLNPGAAVAEMKILMYGRESKGIPRQGWMGSVPYTDCSIANAVLQRLGTTE